MSSGFRRLAGLNRFVLDGAGGLSAWLVNGAEVARASGQSLPGLPARITYADGRWAEYATADGRIVAGRGLGSEVRLEHDAAGRLAGDEQNGIAIRYQRDRTGLLTGIALPDDERIGFSYDGTGLLQAVTDWDGQPTRVAWSNSGQLARVSHANGIESQIESDPLARITALRVQGLGGAVLHEGRYDYDQLDRLVAAEQDGAQLRYAYDGVDRLTAARASDPALDESWTLDPLGNRLVANGCAFAADADNRVSGQGREAIAWDALGRASELELPNGRCARLTHDGRGQLVRIDFAGGGLAEYGYDAFGRRTWKRVDGRSTRYLWAGPTLASELRDPGPGWTRRDHLFLPDLYYPLAMRVDGRTVRLHCDRRGAVVAATGADGELLWRARLKAFGEALIDVAQIEQPWRLANQYCDEESGLHYNLARHYHPGLGRYLSEDPLLDPATRGNWYQYAAGDPLGRADPTGEFVIPAVLIAMAIGAVVGAAITAGIKAYETRGQEWNADRWKQIGVAAAVGGVGGAVGGGAGALAVGALGLAGAVGVGAVLGGAIDGGISTVAQTCTEAAMYGRAIDGGQLLHDTAIGIGIGALTAGIGAKLAQRAAAAKASTEALEQLKKGMKPERLTELAKLDALHATASKNQKTLAKIGKKIELSTGVEFKDPGVKNLTELRKKFTLRNYQKASEIKDISRAGFVVKNKAESDKIVDMIGKDLKIRNDKGWNKLEFGYVDRKIIVEYPDGNIGEVQFIPEQIADYKFGVGHENYSVIRSNPNSSEAAGLLKNDQSIYENLLRGSEFE